MYSTQLDQSINIGINRVNSYVLKMQPFRHGNILGIVIEMANSCLVQKHWGISPMTVYWMKVNSYYSNLKHIPAQYGKHFRF